MVDIEEENLHIFEWVDKFQWNVKGRCDVANIKSHKKPGLHPISEKLILEKPQGFFWLPPPPIPVF